MDMVMSVHRKVSSSQLSTADTRPSSSVGLAGNDKQVVALQAAVPLLLLVLGLTVVGHSVVRGELCVEQLLCFLAATRLLT